MVGWGWIHEGADTRLSLIGIWYLTKLESASAPIQMVVDPFGNRTRVWHWQTRGYHFCDLVAQIGRARVCPNPNGSAFPVRESNPGRQGENLVS